MNVHLLSHVTHYVRLYGPLWIHSCFWFEGMNGFLLQNVHGTNHATLQVCKTTYFTHVCLIGSWIQARWNLTKTVDFAVATGEVAEAKHMLLELNGYQNQYAYQCRQAVVNSTLQ